MIEKPKRPKKISNQDNKQPQTIQELIRRYDLDNTKVYDFLDELIQHLKKTQIVVSATEPTGNNREKVWIQKGKNLFNSNLYIINLAENLSSGYIYLKLEPNTKYTMSTTLPYYEGGANFFVAGGKVTSVSTNENGVGIGESRIIVSDSEGFITIAYRKIIGFTGDLTLYEYQLEQGPTATAYEAYIEPKIYVKNDNDLYEEFINKNILVDYSTVEQRIGTWIDGKALYRKVVLIDSLPNTETKTWRIDDSINYTIVKAECYAVGNNHTAVFPITYCVPDSDEAELSFHVSFAEYWQKWQIVISSKIDESKFSGYAIIEYTKMTD